MTHYILNDAGEPVAVDSIDVWAAWYESHRDEKRVDRTQVGDAEVSTVFLAIDHRFIGDGAPILFETMVFGGPHDQGQWRYTTRAEAQLGHGKVVDALREGRDPDEAMQE